jgi:hypothetical protein
LDAEIKTIDEFLDDKYLQPFLPDDALLFSLDDIAGLALKDVEVVDERLSSLPTEDLVQRVLDAESRARELQREYLEYRGEVEKTLEKRWNANPDIDSSTKPPSKESSDASYFTGYAQSGPFGT